MTAAGLVRPIHAPEEHASSRPLSYHIGIRGTDFWAGPIDNQALGVLLVEGAVSVSNAAGTQTPTQAGQGTNIAAPGAAPGPVTIWPADKVSRALAAVTFR